jgi:hypothetical protein
MEPQQDVIVLPDKHPLRIRAEKAEAQRDELIVVLLGLRALIHDLNVQDADDSWNQAVATADAVMDSLAAKGRG